MYTCKLVALLGNKCSPGQLEFYTESPIGPAFDIGGIAFMSGSLLGILVLLLVIGGKSLSEKGWSMNVENNE